jgi:hypothetical protein
LFLISTSIPDEKIEKSKKVNIKIFFIIILL